MLDLLKEIASSIYETAKKVAPCFIAISEVFHFRNIIRNIFCVDFYPGSVIW